MSHITSDYFEAHPASPLFVEIATYLGIDLSAWEFTDGVEDNVEGMQYITAVYAPTRTEVRGEGYTLYGVFILENGEWQLQQFGTNQDKCEADYEC